MRPGRHPLRFWEYFTRPDDYNMAEPHHSPNWLFLLFPLLVLRPRCRQVVWLLLLSVSFFLISVRVSWMGRFMSFLSGEVSRSDYLKATRSYYQPLDFINRNLPPDVRVMMIGDQAAYDLRREYIAEGGWDSVEWRRLLIRCNSLEEVHQELKRRSITHIVYFPELFQFVAREGRSGSGPSGDMYVGMFPFGRTGKLVPQSNSDYRIQQQNWATFEHFRRKYLEQIFGFETDYRFRVFRLK